MEGFFCASVKVKTDKIVVYSLEYFINCGVDCSKMYWTVMKRKEIKAYCRFFQRIALQ